MVKYKIDFYVVLYVLFLILLKMWIWLFSSHLILISILISSLSSFFLLTIRHNHSHLPIFKSDILNNGIDFLFNVFGGFSSTSVKIIHKINHHSEINSDLDWGKTSTVNGKWGGPNAIKYIFLTAKSFVVNQKRFLLNNKAMKKKLKSELILIWICYITFFILLPFRTLLFLGIPIVIAQFIVIFFNYVQHNNCPTESKFTHSRNFSSPILNLLTCNNGYHTIHHLYPSMHWSKYKVKHDEISEKIPVELNEKYVLSYIAKLFLSKENP